MIDFTTSQLTWIVVGACSLGGGGYLTMTSTVGDLDKKIEVSNARAEAMNEKLSSLKQQLDRIENKIDSGRK
jgi:NADH:ubiquinone oxidoreductase subunit B-like Fe-S oxidoreductase